MNGTAITRVSGGRVLQPDGSIVSADVRIEAGRVVAVEPPRAAPDGDVLDVHGALVAPGFVDTHVHGACGWNFMMGTDDAVSGIAAFLLRRGVTSALMATASVPEDETLLALRRMAGQVRRHPSGLDLLGIHLEGPFLSTGYRGVHRADAVRAPAAAEVAALLAELGDALRLVTIAPELDGAVRAIETLVAGGVRVSLGHTGAPAARAREAVEAGASRATHVLNAMPSRQESPLVDELLSQPGVVVELIADGHHVPVETIRELFEHPGAARIAIVSDGADVTGLPDGPHRRWEGTEVVLSEGTSRTPAGTLAGSVRPLDEALRVLVHDAGVPLGDALRSLSAVPAASIGAIGKGEIAVGKDADLVVLDDSLGVIATVAGGRLVHLVH